MAEHKFQITGMPRVSAIESGHVIEIVFEIGNDKSDQILLRFDAIQFEGMVARIVGMIPDAQNDRRTKSAH
jgi:hypothetical protein